MRKKSTNLDQHQKQSSGNQTQWIDSVDLELIFMNSIAICLILLAIVAADVFIK